MNTLYQRLSPPMVLQPRFELLPQIFPVALLATVLLTLTTLAGAINYAMSLGALTAASGQTNVDSRQPTSPHL